MPHYGDGRATAESIRAATRNALEAADERGAESLVIRHSGCGVAGFDLEEGARIICETIVAYDPETLEDIRFIAYSDDEFQTVQRVADQVRGVDDGAPDDAPAECPVCHTDYESVSVHDGGVAVNLLENRTLSPDLLRTRRRRRRSAAALLPSQPRASRDG